MSEALKLEIARVVSEAASTGGFLDIGNALQQLFAIDETARNYRRDLVNALVSASLRSGVTPQLPIV
jgi:hypothetical protein